MVEAWELRLHILNLECMFPIKWWYILCFFLGVGTVTLLPTLAMSLLWGIAFRMKSLLQHTQWLYVNDAIIEYLTKFFPHNWQHFNFVKNAYEVFLLHRNQFHLCYIWRMQELSSNWFKSMLKKLGHIF